MVDKDEIDRLMQMRQEGHSDAEIREHFKGIFYKDEEIDRIFAEVDKKPEEEKKRAEDEKAPVLGEYKVDVEDAPKKGGGAKQMVPFLIIAAVFVVLALMALGAVLVGIAAMSIFMQGSEDLAQATISVYPSSCSGSPVGDTEIIVKNTSPPGYDLSRGSLVSTKGDLLECPGAKLAPGEEGSCTLSGFGTGSGSATIYGEGVSSSSFMC